MIAITMASALTCTAKANTFTDFSNQDSIVVLGFRASLGTGAAKNLIVSLGSVDQLLGVNGSGAAYRAEFNLSSALSATFGSDWSRSTVLWGAFGSQNNPGNIYDNNSVIASAYAESLTEEQAGVNQDAAFAISGIQGNLAVSAIFGSGLSTGFANATAGANSLYDGYAWASMDASSGGSWSAYNSGPGSFNYFSGEQNWTTDTTLRLAQYNPYGPDSGNPVATLDDMKLSINTTSGVVTVETIPEPSTYALMGLGLLGMILAVRRRNALKA